MSVISVPTRLKAATASLLLCIPLAALQTVIALRAPWWRMPYKSMGVWSLAVAIICIPLGVWLAYGRRWAYALTALFGLLWIGLSTWLAVRMRYPTLGFFSLFLLAYFSLILLWVYSEMTRSFFDPQLFWYQGLPKPIAGLKCQVVFSEKKSIEMKVGRLDQEGTFLFAEPSWSESAAAMPSLRAGHRVDVLFEFREKKVKFQAIPMRTLEDGAGVGFQFKAVTADTRKDLGDFVELLRGEGYV